METKSTKLFQKDFIMIVIGQIISLFGNAIVRYALPLYLLNETHSAALFGVVVACSFLPMILFAPIGGIIADRVNKRNVMVILDFSTAGIMLACYFLLPGANKALLMIVILMLLYGIQGMYQPTVQSSIPALMIQENMMGANAMINMVNSLSGLIGPVLGGVVFSIWGLNPIIEISILCFIASAVMEIFIKIPFEKRSNERGILKTAEEDLKEGFHYLAKEKQIILRVAIILAAINLVFSALIIVGLPILVTEHLGFSKELGNRLYGYAEGALAAGGLLGGMLAGFLAKKLSFQKSYLLILLCAFTLLPIGLSLLLPISTMAAYSIILFSCLIMMILSTIFSIQMMTYVQMVTPMELVGKVMALLSCLVMCAHPVGQMLYGFLFEKMNQNLPILFFGALLICIFISVFSSREFAKIEE